MILFRSNSAKCFALIKNGGVSFNKKMHVKL